MNRNQFHRAVLAAGVVAGLSSQVNMQAQSADALVDKLVEKGILTVKEANALREEADKGFNAAYAVKSGMPDWVNSLKFNGDVRGRFEGIYGDNPNFTDRNRMRYRVRFGVTSVIKDDFEVGFRLTSSEANGAFGGDPISGNTTFSDNGSKKFVFIDLAYGKWTPIHGPRWTGSLSVGKLENPFTLSEMVFDPDYTPEGVSAQLAYAVNDSHSFKLSLGGFALDEVSGSSQDPYLVGAQLREESVWSPRLSTTIGAALLAISGNEELVNGAVPNVNRGNTRSATANAFGAGPLATDFNPLVAEAYATYTLESFPFYAGAFPIRIGGEYMNNLAANEKGQAFNAGIVFGKAGKRGTWELSYKWKQLERDAWYEELVDSDYGAYYQAQFGAQDGFTAPGAGYGAGTNVRGHVIKASYSPYDSLTLSATCFLTRLIDENPGGSESQTTRFQLDALWKF